MKYVVRQNGTAHRVTGNPHLPEDAQPAGYRWTDDESVLHAPSLHLQLFNTQVTTQGNPGSGGRTLARNGIDYFTSAKSADV